MAVAFARGTEAYVELDAIVDNLALFRQRVGPDVAIMAIVKANAYGHGAVQVARTVLSQGADWLGVATAEEGQELREAQLTAPILVLGGSSREQMGIALAHNLDVTVFDRAGWEDITGLAREFKVRPRVHLKVDTGMNRIGVRPEEVTNDWIRRLSGSEVVWAGLMSHLAESDALSDVVTRDQLAVFLDVVERIRTSGVQGPQMLHLANSAATLRYPGTHFNMVRVGIGLYGGLPYDGAPALRPAMTLTSRVTMVKQVPAGTRIGYGGRYVTARPSTIATVAVGYADGYRRALSNRAEVLIQGQRCPVVGAISMDQTTVLVPSQVPVKVKDRVVLIGRDGGNVITVEEVAKWAQTIHYEVMTGISARVPRFYSR
ncbi:MAG: alanine racemase [Sulfobacillus acidophilus]|uniref:Alanine racemase n=1 Tax=Sulfobacillus acidophilus TaxID=53633 RepID=A0A2T2WMR1_9FIRM|nr:MAG: alanine racemase [Sulfobacillus acidophilus]